MASMAHWTGTILLFSVSQTKSAAILFAAVLLVAGCSTGMDTPVSPATGAASSAAAITNRVPTDAEEATATPSPGELELVTAADGVAELHVRIKRPFRIIVHQTTAQGEPTATTIRLNGPTVDLRKFQRTGP
jgi:hypothetical protein